MADPNPSVEDGAVKIYEKVLKLVYNRKYEAAAKELQKLFEKYPEQETLLERASKLKRLCEAQQKNTKLPPKATAEELYDHGVFEHNCGNFDRAVELLEKALKTDSERAEDVHLALAASLVSRGNNDKALKHVKQSIELNQDMRFLALHDPDLEPLRSNDKFQDLVQA